MCIRDRHGTHQVADEAGRKHCRQEHAHRGKSRGHNGHTARVREDILGNISALFGHTEGLGDVYKRQTYLSQIHETRESFTAKVRAAAEKNTRARMALLQIAQQENLSLIHI